MDSADNALALTLPEELLDSLVARVLERLKAEPEPKPARGWMNVEQAARYLACGASRIYDLRAAERIPYRKDGSRLLFHPDELDAWLDQGGGKRP